MSLQPEPVLSTSRALIQAFDNAATWLRPVDSELTKSLIEDEAPPAFQQDNEELLLKLIFRITKYLLDLLPNAQTSGSISGLLLKDADEQDKPITRSFNEFCAEVDEILLTFCLKCRESSDPDALFHLAKLITAQQQAPDAKLKVLLSCFNSEPIPSPLKPKLFELAVEYAVSVKLFDVAIYPPLTANGLEWLTTWNISDEEKAEVAFKTANALDASNHADQANTWRIKGLELSTLKPRPEEVKAVLLSRISGPAEFYFDDLLALPAIERVAKEKEIAPLYSIVTEMVRGNHITVMENFNRHSSELEALGVSKSACDWKAKVITLASEGAKALAESPKANSVTFNVAVDIKKLAEKLGISVEKTEEVAAAAISYGLLDGRLDQLRGNLTICAGMHREFGQTQWNEVVARLEMWRDFLTEMKASLAEAENGSSGLASSSTVVTA